jgi:hypothetical protein
VSDQVLELATEKLEADVIGRKLTTPLKSTGNPALDKKFAEGGYKKEGYGVSVGAAINGNFAFEGNQGYYADGGKKTFLDTVNAMKAFFARHRVRGTPVRYLIKTGIGGQHTPFQGIADGFAIIDAKSGTLVGEYELGKDFATSIAEGLEHLGTLTGEAIHWANVAVIPSSKSGSTDETMMIFVQILDVLLRQAFTAQKLPAQTAALLTQGALAYFHDLNIDAQGIEKSDLFAGFSFDQLSARLQPLHAGSTTPFMAQIFQTVLGSMFFETTDKPTESRLSAFIRNSKLDQALGDSAPGFGAMFENVGGRWTADLHLMTFLAFHDLDAGAYWQSRRDQIEQARNGTHLGNQIADRILDSKITDIALLVPQELFWFGKSNEQNFNESLWQTGFANLIAIPESLWPSQSAHYAHQHTRFVINLSTITLDEKAYNVAALPAASIRGKTKQQVAALYADLFSTFYGITNAVGNRLIARALARAGFSAADVDVNVLANPATKIVQENLFLRQPYVELGKKLVDERFKNLQAEERRQPGAIGQAMHQSQRLAAEGTLMSTIDAASLKLPATVKDAPALALLIRAARTYAIDAGRKFVPFIYLEGHAFQELRIALTTVGVEWVLQGTGDQHISYQQVLAQPQKYLPFIVSFLPEPGRELPGLSAIGFAKAHLDRISPHLLRDYFAEASYNALTDVGGQGFFLRLMDKPQARQGFRAAFV